MIASGAQARTIETTFSATNFSDPLTIDNTYFPLVPGTTLTYKAETKDGCEVSVFTVTSDTRQIDGVTTRVIHDQAYEATPARPILRHSSRTRWITMRRIMPGMSGTSAKTAMTAKAQAAAPEVTVRGWPE